MLVALQAQHYKPVDNLHEVFVIAIINASRCTGFEQQQAVAGRMDCSLHALAWLTPCGLGTTFWPGPTWPGSLSSPLSDFPKNRQEERDFYILMECENRMQVVSIFKGIKCESQTKTLVSLTWLNEGKEQRDEKLRHNLPSVTLNAFTWHELHKRNNNFNCAEYICERHLLVFIFVLFHGNPTLHPVPGYR